MGTTAEKFNYAFGTKDLLKTEINKINNVLDDNSTFRSYPQELFNGYLDILNNGTDILWNNLEKVSASGEEATLENVETAPIKMVLNGNTSQETTKGKNLISKDIGSVVNRYYGIDVSKLVIGQQYTFSSNTPISILKISNTQSGYNSVAYTPTGTFTEFTFTMARHKQIPDTATQYLFIKLSEINWVTDVSQLNGFNLQIESGSTATPYEEYTGGIPSPSPDYPQEVKVVTGENVVSVQGKNLLGFKNPEKVGWIIYVDNPLKNFSSGKYSISCVNSYITSGKGVSISFANENKERVGIFLAGYDFGNTKMSYENRDVTDVEINAKYMLFNPKDNLGTVDILKAMNIQLEQGSTATEYEPYTKTDYPINLGDIELCKINTYKDYFHKDSGKWYVHKEINKVVLNGTEANWTYYVETSKPIFFCPLTGFKPKYNLLCYCDYYKGVGQKSNYNDLYDLGNNVIMLRTNLPRIAIRDDRYTSINDFKTWLSNNNVTLYYVLATPTETEITNTTLIEQLEAISKAKSVKDKTYITQTNDELPFILDVEAIKEYSVE